MRRHVLLDNIGDGTDLQDDHAQAGEGASFHAAIERLPPVQRTVLTLYLEELPIGDHGVTGLEGTIKTICPSRKTLRDLLTRIG
jgi:RNA polymerase sigma-70 factor (ECF subfamily)